MVIFDKNKNTVTIKDIVTFKDLIKILGNEFITVDISGSIKIEFNTLILENESTLLIEDGNYLFTTEKILFNKNSSLIIGSDIIDTIQTKVIFKNLLNIYLENNVSITFKNSIVYSDIDWNLNNDTILSMINSIIKFDITTGCKLIVKNVKLNNFIKSNKDIIVHDVYIKSNFDKEYLLEPKANITFYNGELSSYNKLLDTKKLTKPIRLIFKGTKLNGGYDFEKCSNIEIIHELLLSGKVFNKNGDLITNSEIEIIDKYKNIINTICTDENGHFSIWIPYYTYLNNIGKFHMPYYINNKDNKITISIKENKCNIIIHIDNKIDNELLLLIERVDNKLNNGISEIKTGIANLILNSEKPIKNVSPGSVTTVQGTKLTINQG